MGSTNKEFKQMSSAVMKGQLASLRKHNIQQILTKSEAIVGQTIPEGEIISHEPNVRYMLESIQRQVKTAREFIQELQTRAIAEQRELISESEIAEWEEIFFNADEASLGLRVFLDACEKRRQHELNLEKIRSRETSRSVSGASSVANLALMTRNQDQDELTEHEMETAVKYLSRPPTPSQSAEPSPIEQVSREHERFIAKHNIAMEQVHHKRSEREIADDNEKSLVDSMSEQIQILQQQVAQLATTNMATFNTQVSDTRAAQVMKVKLPKLSIPRFDGNPLKWSAFWDTFQASIHNNSELPLVAKLSYLNSYLDKEAKKAIEGLPVTDGNYSLAVGILTRRYGKEDLRVNSIYAKLRELSLYGTEQRNIRAFTDILETNLRQLEAIGEPVETQQMVSLIKAKLPCELLLRFSERKEILGQPWSVTLLRQYLEQHLSVLQSVSQQEVIPKSSNKEGTIASDVKGNRVGFYSKKWSTGEALTNQGIITEMRSRSNQIKSVNGTSQNAVQGSYSSMPNMQKSQQLVKACIYCQRSGHFHENCPKIQTLEERKKVIANEMRCFNCLLKGHGVKDCQRGRNCFHCGLWGHHPSICIKRYKQNVDESSKTGQARNKYDKPTLFSSNAHQDTEQDQSKEFMGETLLSPGESVLMQTAQALIQNPTKPEKKCRVRIFIDRGSQRSYILKRVVKELDLQPVRTQPLSISTFGSDKAMVKRTQLYGVTLQLKDGTQLELKVNEVPVITQPVQRTAISAKLIPFKDDMLADKAPIKNKVYEIELLLGLDYAEEVIGSTKLCLAPGLFAIDSKLGWVISGRTGQSSEENVNTLALHVAQHSTSQDPFALERIGIMDNSNSKTLDDLAVEIFEETVKMNNGRYSVTWPQERVSRATPFLYTGLDYFGPLYVSVSNNVQKMWVCLFTCLVTRGIHLELVENLSAKTFLNCLKRFIAEYGAPKQILCDNAPAFKASKTVLDKVWNQSIQDPDVMNYAVHTGIKWNFIIEMAPWMGGSYERLIGIVKRALRKALGQKTLDDDHMRTLLSEVKQTVNSRPLTYVGDFNTGYALTPNDFLHPTARKGIPPLPSNDSDDKDYKPNPNLIDTLIEEQQAQQQTLDKFWNQWYSEYLLSKREQVQAHLKTSRIQSRVTPKLNDVVQIGDLKLPRGSWKIAKIINLKKSQDGLVRSATVQLPNGKRLNRAVCHLYPFIQHMEPETNLPTPSTTKDTLNKDKRTADVSERPLRNAAIMGRQKIKQVLNELNKSDSGSDTDTS